MTKRPEPEELLWQLTLGDEDPEGDPVDEEALHAYRAGALGEEQAAALEEQLMASASARRRLAISATAGSAPPIDRVRRKLLTPAPARPPAAWGRAAWGQAAAAAILLISLTLVYRSFAPPDDTRGPVQSLSFDIRIEGEQSFRSDAESAIAYPETEVRLTVESVQAPLEPIEFGLYRQIDGEVVRLTEADGVTTELHRGAAVFTGTARTMVGDEPGQHDLYVVIARVGELPGDRVLGPGESPRESLKDRSTQVHPRTLRLMTSERPRTSESAND